MSSHTMLSLGAWITAPRKSTMFGCRMPCIIRISPLNSCTWDALGLSSCIRFSATSVPFQSAVYTTPKEPPPMRRPSLSSCGGITHRPAACRSARCCEKDPNESPARAGSSKSFEISFDSSIVPGTTPPSPRAAKGAYLADVWPTPCGLRFVGVGAYSLVLSISPSSLKLTLRRSELGPSASGFNPNPPPSRPTASAICAICSDPPFAIWLFCSIELVFRSTETGGSWDLTRFLWTPPVFAASHSAGTKSPRRPVEAPPPLGLSSANAVLTLPASLRASSAVS
mmetsp:Transcript_1475/g.6019  ORF Transcript_1475/g.6019 Transcript_1475/m.6019 type:complete len:283 (+) Transcript_1475:926-1774(+)